MIKSREYVSIACVVLGIYSRCELAVIMEILKVCIRIRNKQNGQSSRSL